MTTPSQTRFADADPAVAEPRGQAMTRATVCRQVAWLACDPANLGQFGGIARGIVFVTAGIFLVVAAAEARPQQAKGIDSALRALAGTPLGPWLLVLVAFGLIMFGVFSCCEAKWIRL